jgi:hypothetical protein
VLVQKAIFRSVCLKALVIYSVSLPMYVKVAHLRWRFVSVVVSCCGGGVYVSGFGMSSCVRCCV